MRVLTSWIVPGECVQEHDAPHPLALLHPRRERPRGCRAAEQRDELAPPDLRVHSITSSAVICMINGTVRPSAFAVLRLITNSSLVGCSTGKSVGLAPFIRRST